MLYCKLLHPVKYTISTIFEISSASDINVETLIRFIRNRVHIYKSYSITRISFRIIETILFEQCYKKIYRLLI